MVSFVLAALALVLTALAAAATLRLRSIASLLLASYLLASAEVVVLTELLSPVHLARAAGYATGEALLLAAALAGWQLRGRPRPPWPRLEPAAAVRRHPIVAALALVVGAAVAYEAFLVVATPPDNWDSMTYHLSRAAAWYERHAVEYFPAHTARENAFQPNAEMEILYTLAFLGRDTLAAAPQLLAELALLVSVFGIARRVGWPRPAALFAALLTATLTEIALQSVTTQNDLVAASLVAAAAFFALGRSRPDAALAGLAIGLSLGTKLTSALALPLLALLFLAAGGRRRLAVSVAWAVAAFAAVGSYGYALNLAETGTLLGGAAEAEAQRPEVTAAGTVSTAARVIYRFGDLSGYHPRPALTGGIDGAAEWAFDALGVPANPSESSSVGFQFAVNAAANEDYSFFGPLGALLVLPLGLAFVVAFAVRRAGPAAATLALAIPLYAVEIAFTFRYNVWLGRFMIAPVGLTMPLAASLYRRRPLALAAAVVGALTLGLTHAYNHAKPTGLDGTSAVWSLSRAQAQAVTRPEMLQVIEGVEHFVRANARLGTIVGPDDWTYPLYGPRLGRKLVPMAGRNLLETAERRHVNWILLRKGIPLPPPRPHWSVVRFPDSGWRMLLFPEELNR